MPDAEFIYKITERHVWADAAETGSFTGMPIDLTDGYIHFSTAGQLGETLRLHFKNRDDLVLLAVPTAPLGNALRWEPSRGGALFPHLYGSLPTTLVVRSETISVARDGDCLLPEWVK